MANEISHSSHQPGVSLGKLCMLMRVNTDAALAYLRHSPESESRNLMASGKETKEKTSEQRKTQKEAAVTKEKVFEQVKSEKQAAETKENVSEQEKTQKEAVEVFLAKAWDNLMNHRVGRKRPTPGVASEQEKTEKQAAEPKEKVSEQEKIQKEAVEAFLAKAWDNLMNHPGGRKRRTPSVASEQEKTEKQAADMKEKVSEQEKTQKEAVEAFLAKAWDNLMNHPVGRKRRTPSVASEQEKTEKQAAETKEKVSEQEKTRKEAVEAFLAKAWDNQMNHPVVRKRRTPSLGVGSMAEVPELKRMKAKKYFP